MTRAHVLRSASPLALFLVSGALLALPGCPAGSQSEASFDEQVAAVCSFYFNCCNAAEREYLGVSGAQYGSDQSECVSEQTKESSDGAIAIGDATEAGRAEWDQEKWEECNRPLIDALNSCDYESIYELDQDADCLGQPWVVGKVANGDLCYETFECEDEEATCVHASELQEEDDDTVLVTARGECVPPAEVGEDCSGGKPCRSGSTCVYDGMDDSFTCEDLPSVGEECLAGQCEAGAYCNLEDDCAALKDSGEDCGSGFECLSGLCEPDPDDESSMEVCENSCEYADDGLCDDGGPGSDFSFCGLGTDCTDCGPRQVGGPLICVEPKVPDDGPDVEVDICAMEEGAAAG